MRKMIVFILQFFMMTRVDCLELDVEDYRVIVEYVKNLQSEDKYFSASQNMRDKNKEDKNKNREEIKSLAAFTVDGSALEPVEPNDETEPKNDFDAVAKQLAGIYIPEQHADNIARHAYADNIEAAWKILEESSLSKIPSWTQQHLSGAYGGKVATIFYPFGGPDVSYVTKFFPGANRYILVGLEAVGDFDNIKQSINKDDVLMFLQKAFNSFLRKGYFITSEMSSQMYNGAVRGVIPVMLLALAKNGYVVHNVSAIAIDENGIELSVKNEIFLDGVKISFYANGDDKIKDIYYIRADLMNKNKKIINLKKFVSRFEFSTFIKSASYALHDRAFSDIRSFILDNSFAILQDDTGIPFHMLHHAWNKQAFGQYNGPTLRIFHGYKQNSLIEFFQQESVEPITFKIGYGFDMEKPNLILAISQKGTAANTKLPIKKKTNCGCGK